jgi:hypothetical protein
MRLASAILFLLLNDGKAALDHPAMGLWEMTVHSHLTLSPKLSATLTARGKALPEQPKSFKTRSCMDLQRWNQLKAKLTTPPSSCVLTKNVWMTNGVSLRLSCTGADFGSVLDANESWPADGHQIHQTQRMTTTYPGGAGESVQYTQADSRFISSDCGSVAPGGSAPVP